MNTLRASILVALFFGSTAHASLITYQADLTGSAEVPPTGSPGTGFAQVFIDTVAQTMRVSVEFSGLLGQTTASHIHCCTASPGVGNAGVATQTPSFINFPLGVTSGTYTSPLFDLTVASTYNSAFVTAEGSVANAESALLAGLAAGDTYLNIHTNVQPGGEIRGVLVVTPEPATLLITAVVLLGLAFAKRGDRHLS